jgi:hypothetical protein
MEEFCYEAMFCECSNLINAPVLSSTNLAISCYDSMFKRCVSLVNPPSLPATSLSISCYSSMFEGCINIEKAPDLPASILVGNCYAGMFYGCKKLSYVKALFVTQPGILYTNNWLYDVAASGTFIKGKYAFWRLNGSNGIPNGWTSSRA